MKFTPVLRTLSSLFYPSYCRSCDEHLEQGSFFCSPCENKIQPVVSLSLAVTQKISMKVFAAGIYKDILRPLVLKKRTTDILASEQMGQLILGKTPIKNISVDLIIPVPLHWTRFARRGYNQAHVMASVIGKDLSKPVLPLISRVRRTPFQSLLSPKERTENVRKAFMLNKRYQDNAREMIQGKHIVLVDDLVTTGQTLINTAKPLLKYKPASITTVVAARAI